MYLDTVRRKVKVKKLLTKD